MFAFLEYAGVFELCTIAHFRPPQAIWLGQRDYIEPA
jgi:hypothetical protein